MNVAQMVSLALVLVACAGDPPRSCTPEARSALVKLYEEMGSEVINAGACDKYTKVEDCPSLRALEVHYLAARKGICP